MWRPGAVEFDAGLITWVGDPGATPPDPRTEVRELGGLVMPGLVNCHGHSPMTLVRSAGDGLPLDRWLTEAVWPREALQGDDDVFWGMTLGASELLLNGVTTTSEQYLHGPSWPTPRSPLVSGACSPRACSTCRASIAEGTWRAHLAEACRIFDEMDGREGRLHIGFGPHAAYSLPPAGLAAVAEEAQRRGALIQIHLAETEAEGRVVEERYGMRAPALLASLGVLDGRVLAAHAIWLDEDDLDAHGRARCGRGALPGEQRQARLGRGAAGRHAGPGDAGRPGHRRARLQRRPPPLGRDAPGRHHGPGHRGRSRGDQLGRRPPAGHPRRRRGARPPGRAPSRSAVRPTSSACAPTTPVSSRPSTRRSCSATWCGPVPAIS